METYDNQGPHVKSNYNTERTHMTTVDAEDIKKMSDRLKS